MAKADWEAVAGELRAHLQTAEERAFVAEDRLAKADAVAAEQTDRANAAQARANEWEEKCRAWQQLGADESEQRAIAERMRFDGLKGHPLRHLLWLRSSVDDAITKHAGYEFVNEVVIAFAAREYRKEIKAVVFFDFSPDISSTDAGCAFRYEGEVEVEVTIAWEMLDMIGMYLQGGSGQSDAERAEMRRSIERVAAQVLG